jgi:hypothetical protein
LYILRLEVAVIKYDLYFLGGKRVYDALGKPAYKDEAWARTRGKITLGEKKYRILFVTRKIIAEDPGTPCVAIVRRVK